jgi:hypothetical protein
MIKQDDELYEIISLKVRKHNLLKMIKPKAIENLIKMILWQKDGMIALIINNAEITKLKHDFEVRLDEEGELKTDDKKKFIK